MVITQSDKKSLLLSVTQSRRTITSFAGNFMRNVVIELIKQDVKIILVFAKIVLAKRKTTIYLYPII
jgi:hypothetical protein